MSDIVTRTEMGMKRVEAGWYRLRYSDGLEVEVVKLHRDGEDGTWPVWRVDILGPLWAQDRTAHCMRRHFKTLADARFYLTRTNEPMRDQCRAPKKGTR
jgi:hypothetical protein